jgi:pSer/pThr/pTyr-binding forkhead associated (FHA) protein
MGQACVGDVDPLMFGWVSVRKKRERGVPARRSCRLGRQLLKYHCRDCPKQTRERCIQECNQAPSVKLMMLRAFEVGRDTQEMWDRLQMNCLLLRQEQEAKAPRSSLLGRRLRRGPEAVVGAAEEAGQAAPPPPSTMRVPDREPARRPAPPRVETRERREVKEDIPSPRYCLILQKGKHRIALPVNGEIVLGRFDAAISVAPDVDLSYDDRENFAISRRHARVIGRDGQHEIEDMGSTNGTRINGMRLRIGQRTRLRPGDRVGLGYCEFVYSSLPELKVSLRAAPEAYLWSAFTGQRFPLSTWGELVIGRSDIAIGLRPDIDLSQMEDAAQVVARRHAKIVARSGRHYVEDLGSASGTQVNGARVGLGEQRALNPGDHIWLGGCVLAYDVEH